MCVCMYSLHFTPAPGLSPLLPPAMEVLNHKNTLYNHYNCLNSDICFIAVRAATLIKIIMSINVSISV